jgi:protein SCO1/2
MKVLLKAVLVMFGFLFLYLNAIANDVLNLYQLKSEWIAQDEKSVKLADFSGEYAVIGMVFTGCAHACPLTINKIKIFLDALDKKDIRPKVLLATFDIKNDTPVALKKYAESRTLDSNIWTFLYNSNDKVVRELALALGISYKELEDGSFSHSNVITFLDKEGNVVGKVESLNEDMEKFADQISSTLSSSINSKGFK